MLEYLIMAILAVAPVSELRGAMLYGLGAGLNHYAIFFGATLLNIAVIPALFWVLRAAKFRNLAFRLFGKHVQSKIDKNRTKFEKYGLWVLIPFVAVPLPMTGAYTGVLITEILDFNRKKAFLAIALGVVIAAAIVFLGLSGVVRFLRL